MRPQLSRRAIRIGSVLTAGLGLALLYVDANFSILGERGMGQTAFAGTPIKVLWVGTSLLILSICLLFYPATRTK